MASRLQGPFGPDVLNESARRPGFLKVCPLFTETVDNLEGLQRVLRESLRRVETCKTLPFGVSAVDSSTRKLELAVG